jgi:hypothetical protein
MREAVLNVITNKLINKVTGKPPKKYLFYENL